MRLEDRLIRHSRHGYRASGPGSRLNGMGSREPDGYGRAGRKDRWSAYLRRSSFQDNLRIR